MNFVDHTGHIFSLPEYSEFPIGYEYSENPYVFWFSDEYNTKLSLNCFYIKPIYILFDNVGKSENLTVNIKLSNTDYFYLINPHEIHSQLDKAFEGDYDKDNPNFRESEISLDYYTDEALAQDPNYFNSNQVNKEITIKYNRNDKDNDIIFVKDYGYLIPFYVLSNVDTVGCWITNVLIEIDNQNSKTYCPISIGGTYVDEQEELIINGKNMGISLPKDILRALYNSSFFNEIPNLALWNQKIKEYLLNYMKLKGERGNFRSAIDALKWFGYGDKIQLSSLIQTNNEFVDQYILDNFDLNFDIINEYRQFRYSTLLSLSIPGKIEDPDGVINNFTWNEDFWGEGKPVIKDKFDDIIEPKHYDEGDLDFLRPYYNWSFNELGLKLCALKYYYKKYFLPIHLSIHRASLTNQCFANDIKLLNSCRTLITANTIFVNDNNAYVKFDDSSSIWLSEEYVNGVDSDTCVYDSHLDDIVEMIDENFYIINDNCFSTPITFVNKNWEPGSDHVFYNKLYFYQEDTLLRTSTFSFCSNEKEYVIRYIIYPKFYNKKYDMNFWLNKKYTIKLQCNGVWYEKTFTLKIPELDIEVGKLKYVYDHDICKQFSGFKDGIPQFNSYMYTPDLINVNNISFINDLIEYSKSNKYSSLPISELNDTNYYTVNSEDEKILLSNSDETFKIDGDRLYLIDNPNSTDLSLEGQVLLENSGSVYSAHNANIDSFIDLYSVSANLPKNKNLNNRIHIFDLYKKDDNGDWNKIKYDLTENDQNLITIGGYVFGLNDSNFIKSIYSELFDNQGESVFETINKLYDVYLMHDYSYWYIILISKNTIGNDSKKLSFDRNYTILQDNYLIKYNRSDDKILVNRMTFDSMNGVYHFKSDDLIVARLNNFNNIHNKLKIGSRWTFTPAYKNEDYQEYYESKSNIGLMNIPDSASKIDKGYYTIRAHYSIDNFSNEYQARTTKILIDDDI